MIFLLALVLQWAYGQNLTVDESQPKSAFEQALQQQSSVTTKERWIEVGQTRYREVIYGDKHFYIKATQREGDDAELDCDVPAQKNPNLTEVAFEVTRRTQMFVSFLRENCETLANGQVRHTVRLDPHLGFKLPDDPKSLIKNKEIYLDPANHPLGVGFSGDW
jgi:hypothetical protein